MEAKGLIFGSGITGRNLYHQLKKENNHGLEIVGFLDNFYYQKDGLKATQQENRNIIIDNQAFPIYTPQVLLEMDFDMIYIATVSGFHDVLDQLSELAIPKYKINTSYVLLSVAARENFLESYKILVDKMQLEGSVAEAGVFRGDFAKVINRFFPERMLYLFDTFEGFSENDLKSEPTRREGIYGDKKNAGNYFHNTSAEFVYSRMPLKEKIVIKQGYFPQTAQGLEEKFCFVNLDMDLYQPTLEGLRFFYPYMVENGVILIHDFFGEHAYDTVKQALYDFEEELGYPVKKIPIGDTVSIAIVK